MPGDCQPLNQGMWVFMALKQHERRALVVSRGCDQKAGSPEGLGERVDRGEASTRGKLSPDL